MYSNPIKKLFGLFFIYAVIIVGIFVLQFKTESVFSESTGALRFTFTKTESNQESHLKNSLQASYKGVLFYFDDNSPVQIKKSTESTTKDITLISWNKASPLTSTLTFTEDVSLTFVVSNSTDSADLIIQADLPQDIEYLSINFKPTKGYHVTEQKNSSLYMEDASKKYILSGLEFADNRVTIFNAHPTVVYSTVNTSDTFTFESAGSYELASASLYSQNLKSLETGIINLFNDALQNNLMLTEQSVVSYVAVMAKNGQYNSALDIVPDLFKKGQRRTYLSAPYFNTLEKMYVTLQMNIENMQSSVNQALEQNNCDIFTLSKITSFILLNQNSQKAKDILTLPEKIQLTDITPYQALGILNVYTNLKKANSELAELISEPIRSSCLETIVQACSLSEEGQELNIKDSNLPFTPERALEGGNTLIQYGLLVSNTDIANTGYFLANSYFKQIKDSDLYAYSDLYPVLVHDNPYYPHFEIIGEDNGKTVWAWTCASDISYKKDEFNTTEIEIVFPQGLTHYVIIGEIPAFQKIQIYGIDFRTDSRFEMYNSSGYVHLKKSNVLLLKSRHRNERETVKLSYQEPVKVSVEVPVTETVAGE